MLVICCLFDDSHSDRGATSFWFRFTFIWGLVMLNNFSCNCWSYLSHLWEKGLSRSHLKNFFFLSSCVSSFYILDFNPLTNMICEYFLSPWVYFPFFWWFSQQCKRFLLWLRSHLFIFYFCCLLVSNPKNQIQDQISKCLLPVFSSRFQVLHPSLWFILK